MTSTHDHTDPHPQPTSTGRADRHPPWCDQSRCTADPASQADDYRPAKGGEHRSAPVPLNRVTAEWLPGRDGTAWLTQACAPWLCEPYLRVQAGDTHLSRPAGSARRVLDARSTLLTSATSALEVNP
jgi:hypothetical protein